jgi:hypothetical protein
MTWKARFQRKFKILYYTWQFRELVQAPGSQAAFIILIPSLVQKDKRTQLTYPDGIHMPLPIATPCCLSL